MRRSTTTINRLKQHETIIGSANRSRIINDSRYDAARPSIAVRRCKAFEREEHMETATAATVMAAFLGGLRK